MYFVIIKIQFSFSKGFAEEPQQMQITRKFTQNINKCKEDSTKKTE